MFWKGLTLCCWLLEHVRLLGEMLKGCQGQLRRANEDVLVRASIAG